MKIDSFFYNLFLHVREAFFALIGEDQQKAKSYEFKSVEIKEQGFRFDGIFLPAKNEDHIHFAEVQFRSDSDLYSGLFAEVHLYLRQYKPINDWRAVVIFPNESFDPGVHPHFREFFESGRLKRIYLNRLPPEYFERFPLSLLRVIMESDQNLPGVIERIVNQLPNEIRDPQEQEKIVDLLVNFLMSRLTNLSREEIEKMFEPMLSDIKKSRAYQEIAHEVALEVTKQVTQDVTMQMTQEMAQKVAASKREIALAMLKKSMTPALISELTGLSRQEVSELRKELVNGSKLSKSRRSGK
jgi:predicted transposase/invertase (TIGR01784 family)